MGKRLLLCGRLETIWFLARVVEKGAFAREEKFQFGKKCKAESWNDIKIIPPPRAFVGRLWFFFFFRTTAIALR